MSAQIACFPVENLRRLVAPACKGGVFGFALVFIPSFFHLHFGFSA